MECRPYAIAAKFAFPSLPAIAMAGDGTMQMRGRNELITMQSLGGVVGSRRVLSVAAGCAESLGFIGVRVDRPEDAGAAWGSGGGGRASGSAPHIFWEQAKNFTRAALRHAEELDFLKQALREGAAGSYTRSRNP
jgi:pyruvate dehydrogenase (quinone)